MITERRQHAEYLAQQLSRVTPNVIVLKGGMRRKERNEMMKKLQSLRPGEPAALIATGRYIGEGFDDARLDTLFLALPISWQGTLAQYAGRLHREHYTKTEVVNYDYVDSDVEILKRMADKRIRGYKALGYKVTMSTKLLGK